MASEDNSTKMDEEIKDNHNNNEDLSNSNESNSESESENYEPSGELFRDESNQITQQSQDLFSESVMEPDMDASNANEDMNATASVSDDMIMKLASQLEKITPHTETSEPNNKCEEPNKPPPLNQELNLKTHLKGRSGQTQPHWNPNIKRRQDDQHAQGRTSTTKRIMRKVK